MRLIEVYYEAGLKQEPHGGFSHTGDVPVTFTNVDLLHLKGLIDDGLLHTYESPMQPPSNSGLQNLLKMFSPESAIKIRKTLGLVSYNAQPTAKFVDLMNKLFSGNEIE